MGGGSATSIQCQVSCVTCLWVVVMCACSGKEGGVAGGVGCVGCWGGGGCTCVMGFYCTHLHYSFVMACTLPQNWSMVAGITLGVERHFTTQTSFLTPSCGTYVVLLLKGFLLFLPCSRHGV